MDILRAHALDHSPKLRGAWLHPVRRLDDSAHFQPKFTQQVIVGAMYRSHAEAGVGRPRHPGQRIGAQFAQAAVVSAGVVDEEGGLCRRQFAQFVRDGVDLDHGGADGNEGVRVDRPAQRCAQGHGGQQWHVGVGIDGRQLRLVAGGDHALGEVVVPNGVEHDDAHLVDALDVFGARLVGVRVETGVDQGQYPRVIADNIGDEAVIGVQGHADRQGRRPRRQTRTGGECGQAGEKAAAARDAGVRKMCW